MSDRPAARESRGPTDCADAALFSAAWFRYGVAVGAVSIAAILDIAARRFVTPGAPVQFFTPAIVFAAVAGGIWPGLLATALAALMGRYVLDLPSLTGPGAGIRVIVFLLEGVMLSGIASDLGSKHRPRDLAWPTRYGAALVILALVLALKLTLLDRVSAAYPFVLMYAAVAGAAWVGGLGPCLLVTAISVVAADWFWLKTTLTLDWPTLATIRLLFFVMKSIFIGLICTRLYDAWTAAARQRDDQLNAGDQYLRLLKTLREHAIFRLDSEGRVTTWNSAAARILGWPVSAAIGRSFTDFATAEDRSTGNPAAELREADETGRSERVGWRQRADGTRFWAETVITSGGNGPGYAVVLRDVSARRQAEEATRQTDEQTRQAQRLEAVGRLAGGIAHDFNNLLTVILGNLDLILEHDTPAEMHPALLDDVRAAGKRAAMLTRQLLSFSRRETAAPRRFDLNAVVVEMGSMLRRVIAEHITLVTELRPGLGLVLADPGQIEQVILNLVVNARDAMPKGGTVTMRTAEVDVMARDLPADAEGAPGRYIVLAVGDTGHGMDAATQARIFEPFFTTKEIGKGTGLGLATVYGNVKQAKGWVALESQIGVGSTFRVYLPRAEGAADAAIVPAPSTAPSTGSETILLVEDEPPLRDLAKRTLESAGYTVLSCADGRAAVEASRHYSGPIDLLVSDLVMPVMNGRHLAAILKQLRPQLCVLFMSGYSDSTLANLSGPEPGEELLDKPFLPDELTRKIRDILDHR
jgi:PAS domain S-box-containing protein